MFLSFHTCFCLQTVSVQSSTTVRGTGFFDSVTETSVSAWQVSLTHTFTLTLEIRAVCVTIIVLDKANSNAKKISIFYH